MNNSDFREAQKGMSCWSIQGGYGTIIEIDNTSLYSIIVENESGDELSFTKDGKVNKNHVAPSLFYNKPEGIKIKVEKTVEINDLWYCPSLQRITQGEVVVSNKWLPAKAVLTYEEEI